MLQTIPMRLPDWSATFQGVQAEKRKRKRAAIGEKVVRLEADSDSDEEQQAEATGGRWSRMDPGLLGSNTPAFLKPVLSGRQ